MVLVICFHRRWETRSRDVYIRVRCTLNLDWQLVSYMIFHMFQCHSPKSSPPLDAWGWCTGTTQRDGVGREEGGGFRMGSTCIPVVDSFWCLAKLIQCFRFKNKIKFKKKKEWDVSEVSGMWNGGWGVIYPTSACNLLCKYQGVGIYCEWPDVL